MFRNQGLQSQRFGRRDLPESVPEQPWSLEDYPDLKSKAPFREKLGTGHPDTLTYMNHLAALHEKQGRLDEAEPTWYSAVPTMHQTLLARAGRNAESVGRAKLRFIRSSSSSLPPQVLAELEETFGIPVVEAYAMTEASHQMTCNQLPPGLRKAGTVGCAAGPEVAVMDGDGNLLCHS